MWWDVALTSVSSLRKSVDQAESFSEEEEEEEEKVREA